MVDYNKMSFGVNATHRYYEFQLDSYDAMYSGDGSTATTDWPLFKIGGKRPLTNIAGIKILEAQIPFTWYTVNSSNNTFVAQFPIGAPEGAVTITAGVNDTFQASRRSYSGFTVTIPAAVYANPTAFAAAVTAAINTADGQVTWNGGYDSSAQEFVFQAVDYGQVAFTFNSGNLLYSFLGFVPGLNYGTDSYTGVISSSEQPTTNPTTATITLVPGNYNATTMAQELFDQLTAATATLGYSTVWGVTYNSTTQKFQVQATPAITYSFNFQKPNDPYTDVYSEATDNPRILLGFNAGKTLSTSLGTLVSSNAIQLTGPNYLYVNSLKIGTLIDMYLPARASTVGSGNSGPQIAKIPINVGAGGVIDWADPDTTKYFDLENLAALTEVDFYLTIGNASAQTPAQLNGVGFSLKIGVLETDLTQSSIGYGTSKNDRVIKRMRPT